VIISRSATVANSSCIGSETYIADGAIVLQSVLGRGCHVGPGAVIQGSYFGDGVHIGCGVTVTHSMLCSGVVVKDEAIIEVRRYSKFYAFLVIMRGENNDHC
jgi:translation initiation factor eIF-2B subunit epsilon